MSETRKPEQDGAARAGDPGDRARLRGWKEIGRHFGVDERTAKRWELGRGLPVHRLPGEARAPVFAFADELDLWLARERQARATGDDPAPTVADARPTGRRRAVVVLALVAAIVIVAWLGERAIEGERLAAARTEELTRLAASQVAAINDQLDTPPGTVAVRAALAAEAVGVLGRVADLERPDAALRRDAAEAWRRLSVLQNAVDRPSLRDRDAARQSLERALALLADDRGPDAAAKRARVQIEAARQAAGGGDEAGAEALLAEAEAVAHIDPKGALAAEWWLVRAELSGWAGDHARTLEAARRVVAGLDESPEAVLRLLRARDLEAEALYYMADLPAARALYAEALAAARDAAGRWPQDSRLQWALLRQQWNLGSTLVAAGDPSAAVPLLGEALAGWQELALADPSDEALASWVRATRMSYGQALLSAGQNPAAIGVLSAVVAERRQWLSARPDDAERRRMLMRGLGVLGDALAPAGRAAEACALYAEAREIGAAMAAAGQLTGFDSAETLRLLAGAEARHCPSAQRPNGAVSGPS